ncbi:MAG: LysR family transcriptional regulator [Acidimicrobiales bacterium]
MRVLPHDTPELAALDLLCSVARLGSLGQVAQRHHVSQPAVSMRMSQLERGLGLHLLDRDRSGTRLTPDGERVVAWSQRVVGEAEAMMAAVEGLRAQRRSRLRVAASFTVADQLVPGWLATLDGAMPDLSVTVEVSNSAGVLERVTDGSVDLGFVEGKLEPPAAVATVAVRDDRLAVVTDPTHPWARRGAAVTGDELARTELVVREHGSGTREVLETALAPFGGLRTRLELGSTEAILAAARSGRGPVVVSLLAVASDLAAGRLVEIATVDLDLGRVLRGTWLVERGLSPLAKRLLEIAGS